MNPVRHWVPRIIFYVWGRLQTPWALSETRLSRSSRRRHGDNMALLLLMWRKKLPPPGIWCWNYGGLRRLKAHAQASKKIASNLTTVLVVQAPQNIHLGIMIPMVVFQEWKWTKSYIGWLVISPRSAHVLPTFCPRSISMMAMGCIADVFNKHGCDRNTA